VQELAGRLVVQAVDGDGAAGSARGTADGGQPFVDLALGQGGGRREVGLGGRGIVDQHADANGAVVHRLLDR
jgi:hypothetical protein